MEQSIKTVLAENVRKILERDASNPTSWTKTPGEKKAVQRILAGHNAELETIERIARLANLQPWQLLLPGLDVRNPPVAAVSYEERAVYEAIQSLAARMPRRQDDTSGRR